ncbi:MAG: enoyl-CoA hydratase-related protein [Nitrospinota bacterium]|nr:enoyl-CoA hydratase-related protein [Nitrospinota bacterium]
MENAQTVHYEIKDHVAWITLNRPGKKNAINRAMRKEIQDAYTDVKFNDDVWAAVITGKGDVFCAGKDLVEKLPEDDGKVMSNDELYLFLRHIYKPVICAINGPCLAQGGGFALNSDIVIMSENACLGWPQVKRGISSVSGPTLLAQAIPWTQAMGYLMRAKFIPAKDCLRIGIANEIVPIEELTNTADRWAKEILSNAPAAVCAVKEAARRGEHLPFVDRVFLARDVANKVLQTEDSKEGIRAFIEKREPKWKGK